MRLARVVAVLLLGALIFGTKDLNSCAFEPLRAIFTAETNHEGADADFAKGQLGILLPRFRRAYLVVAYRYLSGLKLNGEISFQGDPQVAPNVTPAELWNAARGLVGLPPAAVNPYKEDTESHLFFLNCKDDAFRTAAETLTALVKKYGASSNPVKDWAAAQDLVFQNCSAGPAIPQPLTDSPERAYQIAAAHFYSGQYEAARAEFGEISRDAKSPWHGLAPYLVARTLIRQGDLKGAEDQVQAILKDPAQQEGWDRARRLDAWIRIRLYPAERMVETARAVMEPDSKDLQQALKDYTYLYDQLEGQQDSLQKAADANDLTDWILDFQHSDAVEGHAMERWRALHSTPWLIAALAAKPEDAAVRAELLKAADGVPRESAGFLTVQYFASGLVEGDAARARLDRVLETNPPRAALNLLRAARMRLARNWPEFLRDAQRIPVDMDGYDYASGPGKTEHTTDEIGFDGDGIYALNHYVPLAMMASAAMDKKLPAGIRRQLATAAWTKAVLLQRYEIARKVAPAMDELYPGRLAGFELARDSGGAEFDAVWAMLHHPGVRPYPEAGFGRVRQINRLDEFRDNWWCKVGPPPLGDAPEAFQQDGRLGATLASLYGQEKPNGNFVSAEDRETAKKERVALSAVGTAPAWLAEETLKFARSHPEDKRIPEALHLVVRSTRYGCADDTTPRYSREAFELLHTKYPANEWTRATPYWFKN